jgi:hypothetical protein
MSVIGAKAIPCAEATLWCQLSGYGAVRTAFASRAADRVALPLRPTYLRGNAIKGLFMTTFDDRERAFEAKYARDEDMAFRVIARRNRLLGHWAAVQMGLTPEETDAYAKAVVQADFEEAGDEDVIRKLLGDLLAAGIETDDATVRRALSEQLVEARRQLMESK